jgi:hypothetical protein
MHLGGRGAKNINASLWEEGQKNIRESQGQGAKKYKDITVNSDIRNKWTEDRQRCPIPEHFPIFIK